MRCGEVSKKLVLNRATLWGAGRQGCREAALAGGLAWRACRQRGLKERHCLREEWSSCHTEAGCGCRWATAEVEGAGQKWWPC